VGVFGKLPWENELDHKSSRLSIRWLNSTTGESPATILTQSKIETAAKSKHKQDLSSSVRELCKAGTAAEDENDRGNVEQDSKQES
jgi:hypothetical protein